MSDLISRQAAIDAFYKGPKRTTRDVLAEIKTLPSAQPERGKGRWLNINESEKWECSECGRMMWFSPRLSVKPSDYKFCPNCGADMRGEQDDESRSKSNAQTDTRARGMGTTDKSSGI